MYWPWEVLGRPLLIVLRQWCCNEEPVKFLFEGLRVIDVNIEVL